MSMTARDVYERAMALIDETETDGSISSEYAADYEGKAPRLIDTLQHELAFYESVTLTASIDDLDDVLEISDDTAVRIMPYGLASVFALADKNTDMYGDYSSMYRRLCNTIRSDEADITDGYEILDGMS